MIAAGDIGDVRYIHGAYLQDWLIQPTDYSWRLDPAQGGDSSAMGDIGSHWCDLVQHVTGQRIVEVLADLSTVVPTRVRPSGSREAFARQEGAQGQNVTVRSEDLATVLLRFDGGAKGCVSVGQVCAGHRNDLWFEANGRSGSLRWRQEVQNELWIGRRGKANRVMAAQPRMALSGVRSSWEIVDRKSSFDWLAVSASERARSAASYRYARSRACAQCWATDVRSARYSSSKFTGAVK